MNRETDYLRRIEDRAERQRETPPHWIYPNSSEWVGTAYLPLESTAWDGDARSTTAKTLIDLSAVFGVPAGVKAVDISVEVRDSGSAAGDPYIGFSPEGTTTNGKYVGCAGQTNDAKSRDNLTVPCNADGDIYYRCNATGTNTLDVWLRIWGYEL